MHAATRSRFLFLSVVAPAATLRPRRKSTRERPRSLGMVLVRNPPRTGSFGSCSAVWGARVWRVKGGITGITLKPDYNYPLRAPDNRNPRVTRARFRTQTDLKRSWNWNGSLAKRERSYFFKSLNTSDLYKNATKCTECSGRVSHLVRNFYNYTETYPERSSILAEFFLS